MAERTLQYQRVGWTAWPAISPPVVRSLHFRLKSFLPSEKSSLALAELLTSIDGGLLWAKIHPYARFVVIAHWLLLASLVVVIVLYLLLFPGCLSSLALVARLTHDLTGFLLLQTLGCKCVLVDGMFVQLILNSLLCCHGNLELAWHIEHQTNAPRDELPDADFLPDCNLHGTLGSLLGSGTGLLAGNNRNCYIGYGQCIHTYSTRCGYVGRGGPCDLLVGSDFLNRFPFCEFLSAIPASLYCWLLKTQRCYLYFHLWRYCRCLLIAWVTSKPSIKASNLARRLVSESSLVFFKFFSYIFYFRKQGTVWHTRFACSCGIIQFTRHAHHRRSHRDFHCTSQSCDLFSFTEWFGLS